MEKIWVWLFLFTLLGMGSHSSSAQAEATTALAQGQTLYVPAYSHIYAGNRGLEVALTVTLSIRNTDPQNPITLTAVDYYGSKGELLKKQVTKALVLNPLESTRYIIPPKDKTGGSGANFLVVWQSEKSVNPPLIESVMIGAEGQQGISFTSRAQVLTTAK